MDWEWIPLGIMLVLVGSFYVGSMYLAFTQGIEVGKRLQVAPVSRPRRASVAPSTEVANNRTQCADCGRFEGHHADCPQAKPKAERPDRRRWMGFSRIKAELESKESA